jgi:hypothetical protein
MTISAAPIGVMVVKLNLVFINVIYVLPSMGGYSPHWWLVGGLCGPTLYGFRGN